MTPENAFGAEIRLEASLFFEILEYFHLRNGRNGNDKPITGSSYDGVIILIIVSQSSMKPFAICHSTRPWTRQHQLAGVSDGRGKGAS